MEMDNLSTGVIGNVSRWQRNKERVPQSPSHLAMWAVWPESACVECTPSIRNVLTRARSAAQIPQKRIQKLHKHESISLRRRSPFRIQFGRQISKYSGKFRYSLMTVHEEIKCRLKAGNSCYYSVQILLSSRLPSKNLNIKILESLSWKRGYCE